MPVKFRCRHCHQLLGIARRKIGMEILCPTCHSPVMVPATDAPDLDQPAVHKPDPLFEGSDLDALLQPAPGAPAISLPPTKHEPAAAWPAVVPPPAAIDVEPYKPPPPAAPAGLMLSPLQATLLSVATVLLLAVFFAAGLLIGRYWL